MMGAYVVLALVVSKILLPGVPFNFVDILCFFVTNPKISHFHRSRSLSFYSVVCDANGGGIVAMYRCSWLGMSQFFEGESKNDSLFAIEEESAEFCLGHRGHNETEDGA
jgi:hypothetical protein